MEEAGGSCPKPTKRSIIARPGFGSSGHPMPLLSNHFKVSVNVTDVVFYQYSVSITAEDNRVVDEKRKIIDRLCQTYSCELAGKSFAYDGEKTLYSLVRLPQSWMEFTVVPKESIAKRCNADGGRSFAVTCERSKRRLRSETFKVEIVYAAKIPLNSLALSLHGNETNNNTRDALRVLDSILKNRQSRWLPLRQTFFHDDPKNFTDVGGGITGVRGYHSSFRTTQGGLSLNMDVTMTMFLTPGPVIDFLKANQNVQDPCCIDWVKAKSMLKNLRVKPRHRNKEYKIIGLSQKVCKEQYFSMKVRSHDCANGEPQVVKITVYEYFTKHCGIELTDSACLPCLDVGNTKQPIYLPIELCTLVPLQRYAKALFPTLRASLVASSRQNPQDRKRTVIDAVRNYRCDDDSLLSASGVSIERQMMQVDSRVLETPMLRVGNKEDLFPRNGRWNFNYKTLFKTTCIDRWAVVNFSAPCYTDKIFHDLISCGRRMGIQIESPRTPIWEDPKSRGDKPLDRVENMFEMLNRAKLLKDTQFILCVLPEKKSDIYGPWKKKCLCDFGIVTQCIYPSTINDRYLTNVLLKINSKLGGINSLLAIEDSMKIPLIKDTPTMILGMGVSLGFPGRSDIPSVAAVVGSLYWPHISRYRASVRAQSPKEEMIDALYNPLANGKDDGMMRKLLEDFCHTSNGNKPKHIIVFRNGVAESQFSKVLNVEVEQILKAYQDHFKSEVDIPKFTVIVAQKDRHTKLFQDISPENVPSGTVVDTEIVHPRNYDFYLCAHASMTGTSRPAHYHILLDEIGFSPDELQNLIHALSYVNQRSTTAIRTVAPLRYANLAARQMGRFMKFEDNLSEISSGQGPVPELPRLHENVASSMFFC
ncbi:protein argonaute 16-like [Hevea brasiliensis]|uniref:protein argonaute 16-like n=1 Tax=Hevea brasiliensis TaxID=3981 RepID=UPI0025DAF055|nr:protein argonaute 16-like [Hevea brasiliensis]